MQMLKTLRNGICIPARAAWALLFAAEARSITTVSSTTSIAGPIRRTTRFACSSFSLVS